MAVWGLYALGLTGGSAGPARAQENALPHLLGSCSTPLAGSTAARIANIERAAQRLSGTRLRPDETLSFNETVGERTQARGFLPAPAIVRESLRPVIGGGICQVSSTLFNAVLLSDLRIVERHRHSTPVNYLPLGMDATVSWGTKDLRFQNSLAYRIEIIAHVSETHLTFEIYGDQPLEKSLRLETEYHQSPSPFPNQESEPGMEILLYRILEEDGRVRMRELIHSDFYPARVIESAASSAS